MEDKFRFITWQEAEKLLGVRVDRRGKYAWGCPWGDDKYKVTRCYVFSEACSGCYETPEMTSTPGDAVGMGCRECGYQGRVKKGFDVEYKGIVAEKEAEKNL